MNPLKYQVAAVQRITFFCLNQSILNIITLISTIRIQPILSNSHSSPSLTPTHSSSFCLSYTSVFFGNIPCFVCNRRQQVSPFPHRMTPSRSFGQFYFSFISLLKSHIYIIILSSSGHFSSSHHVTLLVHLYRKYALDTPINFSPGIMFFFRNNFCLYVKLIV